MTLDQNDIYDIAKAVVKVIKKEDMMAESTNIANNQKRIKLNSLKNGDVFKLADRDWIVLSQSICDETCFCITKDFLLDTQYFNECDNKWEHSSLRSELDSMKYEIEEYEIEEGVDPNLILQYHTRNLMALDGTNKEICSDKISLLTLDEYRLYREYLEFPNTSKKLLEWVLLTPVTDSYHSGVCAVSPDGSITTCCCNKKFNIRPVCTFKSNILVEKVDS